MLTFRQATNFRQVVQMRLGALMDEGVVGRVSAGGREELVNRVLLLVAEKDAIAAHRLLELPMGIGNAAWRRRMHREVARTLGLRHEAERGWVLLATGSALRLALLHGCTYEGGLERGRILSRRESGWKAEEAVAFAKRFTPRGEWNRVHGPKVVLLEQGAGADDGWAELFGARARDEVSWSDIVAYRTLRRRYDAYVSPAGDLLGTRTIVAIANVLDRRLRKVA